MLYLDPGSGCLSDGVQVNVLCVPSAPENCAHGQAALEDQLVMHGLAHDFNQNFGLNAALG